MPNLNDVSVDDLKQAFQVNEERAQDIIDVRDRLGGFKSWDELKQIPGINDEMIRNLQEAGFEI